MYTTYNYDIINNGSLWEVDAFAYGSLWGEFRELHAFYPWGECETRKERERSWCRNGNTCQETSLVQVEKSKVYLQLPNIVLPMGFASEGNDHNCEVVLWRFDQLKGIETQELVQAFRSLAKSRSCVEVSVDLLNTPWQELSMSQIQKVAWKILWYCLLENIVNLMLILCV